MLGIPVLLSVFLLIFTVFVRWRSKDEEPRKVVEEFHPLPVNVMASPVKVISIADEPEIEAFGFDEYRSNLFPARHQCAVCFSQTSTRCSRCKAVRYCSSKCQIAHWRQGHKYECQPQVVSVYERNDSTYERNDSGGKVETLKRGEISGDGYAEGSVMKHDKRTDNKRHSNVSDSHFVMPRLSTVSVDSSDNTVDPWSSGEHEGPVLVSNTLNMVQKDGVNIKTSMKSLSTGLENSVNKYKDTPRQGNRTKARASHSNSSPSFKKDHFSEGVFSGDLQQQQTSKDVSELDPALIERQKHSESFKHREEKLLTTEHSGSSFLPVKGGSSSSALPPSGLKSSLQKVVRHLKTPHPRKPPLRHSLLKTPSKHNLKSVFQYDTFTKLYSSNEVELKPFGLVNCGNSCYANAVLQCLTYTRPLTLFLLEGIHSKECWKETWCFMCEFEQLILKAREGYTPLSPVRILSNISHLGHGREEDAHEFLRYSVDTMQSICIEQAGTMGPVAEETTLIGMTFGGYLHSKIKCMKCGNKSEKYERMMDLTVEIDGDIRTLEQALKRFTASEILEGDNKYYCSRCKSYEKAKKKLTVFQVPNILTIVLKRFQAGNFTKLNKRVQFPEILNMTPYMSGLSDRFPQYSLYAVVVHLNAMNAAISGHYVCYVKNYHGKWFKMDDSMVISVDVERVLSEEAYMLLYSRHSPRHPAVISNVHNGKHYEVNPDAVSRQNYEKLARPETRLYSPNISADPLVMQHRPSRNGHVKNPSYLEEWVTHSVKSIPLMDSSSEASSLFSYSEEGTCSTPSTKDSASVEDFSGCMFGRSGAANG